mmetsp:Transcript_95380/g.199547  ORF Transcript_95380/g.199547 Transcript_95380/m.199547 type:complete len:469 (+) Transcript_95380:62-1468(+)
MAWDEESTDSEAKAKHDGISWSAYTYQVVIVGAGFLADAYDLFVIDLVMSILDRLHPGGLTASDKSLIAGATLLGAIFGQLSFGLLGDFLGRRWTFLLTCVLIVFGAVLSGCTVWVENSAFGLVGQLVLCRFLLGVGVGGEYPLAATIASEAASPKHRGALIAGVFSMQGWGMLLSCLLVLFLLWIGVSLEWTWRIVLIFGAVPSAAVIFVRTKMEETTIFKEAQQEQHQHGFYYHWQSTLESLRAHWRLLVGTTMTWLLLDVTFYGTGSFKHKIASSLHLGHHATNDRDAVWEEALFATLCSCMAIPGYLLSIAFVDKLGRYEIQFWGFLAIAANFFLVAGLNLSGRGPPAIMILCFGLTFLFSNFGPNTTTFMLPAEVYPTMVRATCHGLSAASGKLGAAIGTMAFSPFEAKYGIEAVLTSCGVVCLIGAAVTYGFTPRVVAVELSELEGLVLGPSKIQSEKSHSF